MSGIKHLSGVMIMSFVLFTACADEGTVEEPVLEGVDTSEYPDDPAMTDDPVMDDETNPFPDGEEPEDGIGELTDEPFQDDSSGVDPADDFDTPTGPSGEETTEDTSTPDSEMAEMYSDSFDNEPGYDITEPIEGDAAIPDSILNTETGAADNSDAGGEVVRYVDALLLNVRSSPNLKSPIVRRLLGGAKLTVTVENGFAKIRDGQYVAEKFLSPSPTRKVSRSEVINAWKKSRYKDTWVPPR